MVRKHPTESVYQDPIVYDVKSYCAAHRKSRSALYNDWAKGRGPDFYKEGSSVRITGAAASRYRAKLEEDARIEREAKKVEQAA